MAHPAAWAAVGAIAGRAARELVQDRILDQLPTQRMANDMKAYGDYVRERQEHGLEPEMTFPQFRALRGPGVPVPAASLLGPPPSRTPWQDTAAGPYPPSPLLYAGDPPSGPPSGAVPPPAGGPPSSGYGLREDGTPKGEGFFGPLPARGGGVMTELSATFTDPEGREILAPLISPGLDYWELVHLLAGGEPTPAIAGKARSWAEYRRSRGLEPWARQGERLPLPPRTDPPALAYSPPPRRAGPAR